MGVTEPLERGPVPLLWVMHAVGAGVGLWMLVSPGTIRHHDSLDWLDPVNLDFAGSVLIACAVLQFVADVRDWSHLRALAAAVFTATYLMFVVGTARHDPVISSVAWAGMAIIELLLTLRRA